MYYGDELVDRGREIERERGREGEREGGGVNEENSSNVTAIIIVVAEAVATTARVKS